jgi:uncharacterized YigZ family protein
MAQHRICIVLHCPALLLQMTHTDAYKTIERPSEGDYRDRGSKFMSYLFPCENEDQLKGFVNELRKQHPSSRHVCYGAILGIENGIERSIDDGEPNGTAGLPILNQLLSAELKSVALLVVRYFGGTKLGKSGLINAYKESAKEAINNAKLVTRYVTTEIQFRFNYDATGVVMQAIENIEHAIINEQVYDQDCLITVSIPKSELDKALHLFDHTNEVDVSQKD